MHGNKENQEISVVGRLFSLEALVLLMGAVSFVYGLVTGDLSDIVIGALIIVAAVYLACRLRRIQLRVRQEKGEQHE